MGRPVALLDVDHTLLFDDTFNENLLNSLKKNGIQDVYLFTDMRFRKLEVEDRVKLVQRLQAQGFTVHGVITPMDLVWSHMSAENTATLNSAIIEGGYKGKFLGKPFDDFLKSKQEEIPFIQDVMTYSADSCEPGISFRHAVEAYNRIPAEADETTPLPDEMFERSSFGKVLGDCHAERQNFAHTKALMLDVFLRHKPDWAKSVIVADDNENVLQAIGQYKERVNPAIAVSSIAVRNDSHPVSYYDDIIEQHLSNDPEYKIIKTIESRIDQHIEALNKTNWNIFLTSSDAKVKALEMLKSNLHEAYQRGEPISIKDVIEDWEKSLKFMDRRSNETVPIAKVLSQHRNIFRAEFRNEQTSTQKFIQGLKQEFGQAHLHQPPEEPRLESHI